MNRIDFNLHEWKHEMWDNYILMEEKKESKREGKREGKEEGIAIGENKLIKNMFNHKLSLNEISKISGKSISEVEKIVSM